MSEIVSFESELLILVNSDDEPIGHETKSKCHHGRGILHRAFSILIFNSQNQLLLQQRSSQKRLWGGYWANSCCSHPRQGESMDEATARRLGQELGLRCSLTFLYKFEYQARFEERGSEHELCWVYAGRCDDEPTVNPNEIAAWRWIDPEALDVEMVKNADQFSPWFQIEWAEIRDNHWQTIKSLA